MTIAKRNNYNKTVYKSKRLVNNTNYGRSGYADAVWSKATPMKGKDPKIWKLDVKGKVIKRRDLNSASSPYAWNIDHIIPKSKGGSDDVCNLQPMNRVDNIRYSDKLTNDKPGYSKRVHHDALLLKHGMKRTKMNFPKMNIGNIVYAKQTPVMKQWSTAKVLEIDEKKDRVKIHWVDANYEETLPYDALLFSKI